MRTGSVDEHPGFQRPRGLLAAAVVLDMIARLMVIALLVLAIRRASDSACTSDEFCDALGLQTVLITPFVMYLVWNAVVVLVEAAWWVDRKRGTVVVVAVGAVVRLLWLVPLTTNDLGRWPWLIVPLVVSIASAVTAILAVLPESLPGDGQAGAPGKVT